MVFVSGQIPIDPATGLMVTGSIEEQVKRVLENVKIVLESCGSSMEEVVKVGVYLRDLGNFQAMNAVYEGYFSTSQPARSTIEVCRLPKDADVEIDVIALE
jgi:2-iminobutanoate/2-iminopropanoate deaminase